MAENGAGKIVRSCWEDLPDHYPHVTLDAFVVMPNHVHGIVVLNDGPDENVSPDGIGRGGNVTVAVGAGFKPAPTGSGDAIGTGVTRTGGAVGTGAPIRHGLPEIVRALKTFSARRINALRGTPGLTVWQRNYYEHVIRNERTLGRVREYILANPQNWWRDRERPVWERG